MFFDDNPLHGDRGLPLRFDLLPTVFSSLDGEVAFNSTPSTLVPSRFTEGDRIDCAISEFDFEKRKITLSIKLLEEIEKQEALAKYGSEGSGKNLPFSSLSEDLKKKEKKK